MHLLKVQPELRAIAEEAGHAQRGVRRDQPLAVNNFADARCGHTNLQSQGILRNAEGNQELLLQRLAGVCADPL